MDMMTENRLAQARAEAEWSIDHLGEGAWTGGVLYGVTWGVEWADANPQPTTITRAEASVTNDEWKHFQKIPDQGYSARHVVNAMIRRRLEAAGIEVTDDE